MTAQPVNDRKTHVLHLITGLGVGGAELMLARLLSWSDTDRFNHVVVSMMELNSSAAMIDSLGIPLESLGMKKGRPNASAIWALDGLLRRHRPDVVHAWCYHANLLGSICAPLRRVPIIWALHHGLLEPSYSKCMTRKVSHVCARLSRRVPSAIVCCSEATRTVHIAGGYDGDRMEVICNGFDTSAFSPDRDAKLSLSRELGLDPDTPFVVLAARFHPQKDHETFCRAARLLVDRMPEVRILMCGRDITWDNETLKGYVLRAGIEKHVRLLGVRHDMQRILAAALVVSSSSTGEGLPLSLGEAASCGALCVATDVGGSAEIVGETGWIVPPRDPVRLAEALAAALALSPQERDQRTSRGRARIAQRFGIRGTVEQYERLYLRTSRKERVTL